LRFLTLWHFNQPKEYIVAVAVRETSTLIGSDKIEDTAVYGADGNKIGFIERVMLEKVSGRASYAVLSFGGLLGIGDDHYPLPWQALAYDTSVGGYRVNLTRDQLDEALRYGRTESWDLEDRSRATALYNIPWAAY
jgi:PRC-barrel domain